MRRTAGLSKRPTAASSTARARLPTMADEKIRLGGMALANGVLVHGPNAWACAIRTPEGELKVESAYKGFRAAEVERPFLRGPARLAEVMLLLPQVRRALPEARLPFERPRVLATMLGSAVGVATELFSWMVRNPDRALSRALAKPGHELQHRLATEDPTPEQLEVAEAALAACLELEHGAAGTR